MGGKRNLFFKNWILLAFVLFLTLGISGISFAQDEDSDEFTLEEITVTAEMLGGNLSGSDRFIIVKGTDESTVDGDTSAIVKGTDSTTAIVKGTL